SVLLASRPLHVGNCGDRRPSLGRQRQPGPCPASVERLGKAGPSLDLDPFGDDRDKLQARATLDPRVPLPWIANTSLGPSVRTAHPISLRSLWMLIVLGGCPA